MMQTKLELHVEDVVHTNCEMQQTLNFILTNYQKVEDSYQTIITRVEIKKYPFLYRAVIQMNDFSRCSIVINKNNTRISCKLFPDIKRIDDHNIDAVIYTINPDIVKFIEENQNG